MHRKTVMIDLDGVLNTYNGNYNEKEIPPPKEGARNFLFTLAQNFDIKIFTVRDNDLTKTWFEHHGLGSAIKAITNIKDPFASVIVDDRALRFDGDFEKTLNEILNFKPHWK